MVARDSRHVAASSLVSVCSCVVAVAWLFLYSAEAFASKEAISYFGTASGSGALGGEFHNPEDSAVNSTGAGAGGAGDVYVIDRGNNRVQRFALNDNATPADPYDDSYEFLSAWGGDVDSTPSGGTAYEICTLAADCQSGAPAGDNGGLSGATAIAVDQDTGLVYVSDGDSAGNARVNVYDGAGTFIRSFGFDVVVAGPGNIGTGYEICVAANGDLCQAGTYGPAIGQVGASTGTRALGIAVSPGDGNPSTGTIYLADSGNRRINTYSLDGTEPGAIGSATEFGGNAAPKNVAVDSRGIVYADNSGAGDGNAQQIERYDTQNVNGDGVGFLDPIPAPPLLSENSGNQVRAGLEVDPDSDGVGPDADVLYALRSLGPEPDTVVQQFGPINSPGLSAPPISSDDSHGSVAQFNFVSSIGLGLDATSGRLLLSNFRPIGGPFPDSPPFEGNHGVYVLDTAGGVASATLDSVTDVTSSTASVHGTVTPNGPPDLSYHVEYSTDGTTWASTPSVVVGSQDTAQPVTTTIDPPGVPGGLEPDTLYHVRLVAARPFNPPVVTPEATFVTLPAPMIPPSAETVGSVIRTATTAELAGRVDPRGFPTTYQFEYGTEGPCGSHTCSSTPARPVGSGAGTRLIAERLTGLEPDTTYHYRIVADNGNPGSPVSGSDRVIKTRRDDAPLEHGDFPGPPGSDRAWEQVNAPDNGGNMTGGAAAISDDGDRAAYGVVGGTPLSDTGSFNQFYTERTPDGWDTKRVYPPRAQLPGPNWSQVFGRSDLSAFVGRNFSNTGGGIALFRIAPDAPPVKLHQASAAEYDFFSATSDDSSLSVMALSGAPDPDYPTATAPGLYDVSSGTPSLLSILPGDVVPACGVLADTGAFGLPVNYPARTSHWLSADGRKVFFPSRGVGCGPQTHLYVRDVDAGETTLLSGPSLSGPNCSAAFIKSTPDAAFFWTQSRLSPEDRPVFECDNAQGGDVYRVDLADHESRCLTCLVPDFDTDVQVDPTAPAAVPRRVAVAEDGSRLYFSSPHRLLLGASEPGVYRLDVDSGDLAFVAPIADEIGDGSYDAELASLLTRDGSRMLFRSADPDLNPLGGTDNGGTAQYYLYGDEDRSLVCVSCPQDGSAAVNPVPSVFNGAQGPNLGLLSEVGTVAFISQDRLVEADHNTAGPGQDGLAGQDVYEWRDGRLFLVSDGSTSWPGETGGAGAPPRIQGITPDGTSIFFTESAALTPDAVDGFLRLYVARIGGGFEFPEPEPPCSLEDCQGPPSPVPTDPDSGSSTNTGPGNEGKDHTAPAAKRCKKGRKLKKGKCVKKKRNKKGGHR